MTCNTYKIITSHVHRAHDDSDPFMVLWVHMDGYKYYVVKTRNVTDEMMQNSGEHQNQQTNLPCTQYNLW